MAQAYRRLWAATALLVLALALGCMPRSDTRSGGEPPAGGAGLAAGGEPQATGASVPKPAQPATVERSEQPVPPRAGEPAWDFALDDLSGKRLALSDLRGRYVMLNFWASWCPPCRDEMPHMVALYDELHAEGFEILAVNVRESPERVAAFVDEFAMRFPVLLDRNGAVTAAYFVRGMPTSVFVDTEGLIYAVHLGGLTESQLRVYVEGLMAE